MSAYPAYNMGSTALSRAASPARKRRQSLPASPEKSRIGQLGIEVLPGNGQGKQRQASNGVVLLAKIALAVLVVFALVGIARITLSSTTVAVALEAKDLNSKIDVARDEGSLLEVTRSSLANPSRVKQEATAIGMAVPESSKFMDMSGDIVVLDETGNLSLTGTALALDAS